MPNTSPSLTALWRATHALVADRRLRAGLAGLAMPDEQPGQPLSSASLQALAEAAVDVSLVYVDLAEITRRTASVHANTGLTAWFSGTRLVTGTRTGVSGEWQDYTDVSVAATSGIIPLAPPPGVPLHADLVTSCLETIRDLMLQCRYILVDWGHEMRSLSWSYDAHYELGGSWGEKFQWEWTPVYRSLSSWMGAVRGGVPYREGAYGTADGTNQILRHETYPPEEGRGHWGWRTDWSFTPDPGGTSTGWVTDPDTGEQTEVPGFWEITGRTRIWYWDLPPMDGGSHEWLEWPDPPEVPMAWRGDDTSDVSQIDEWTTLVNTPQLHRSRLPYFEARCSFEYFKTRRKSTRYEKVTHTGSACTEWAWSETPDEHGRTYDDANHGPTYTIETDPDGNEYPLINPNYTPPEKPSGWGQSGYLVPVFTQYTWWEWVLNEEDLGETGPELASGLAYVQAMNFGLRCLNPFAEDVVWYVEPSDGGFLGCGSCTETGLCRSSASGWPFLGGARPQSALRHLLEGAGAHGALCLPDLPSNLVQLGREYLIGDEYKYTKGPLVAWVSDTWAPGSRAGDPADVKPYVYQGFNVKFAIIDVGAVSVQGESGGSP